MGELPCAAVHWSLDGADSQFVWLFQTEGESGGPDTSERTVIVITDNRNAVELYTWKGDGKTPCPNIKVELKSATDTIHAKTRRSGHEHVQLPDPGPYIISAGNFCPPSNNALLITGSRIDCVEGIGITISPPMLGMRRIYIGIYCWADTVCGIPYANPVVVTFSGGQPKTVTGAKPDTVLMSAGYYDINATDNGVQFCNPLPSAHLVDGSRIDLVAHGNITVDRTYDCPLTLAARTEAAAREKAAAARAAGITRITATKKSASKKKR